MLLIKYEIFNVNAIMPYNWSFYHLGPIEGEEGGILLFC